MLYEVITDLPAVIKIAGQLGAGHLMISNILPYSKDMKNEILYEAALATPPRPELKPKVRLPLMDMTDMTADPIFEAVNYGRTVTVGSCSLNNEKNHCRFIEDGAAAVGWNGDFRNNFV